MPTRLPHRLPSSSEKSRVLKLKKKERCIPLSARVWAQPQATARSLSRKLSLSLWPRSSIAARLLGEPSPNSMPNRLLRREMRRLRSWAKAGIVCTVVPSAMKREEEALKLPSRVTTVEA